ncbi:MAG: response regulator transcription factor [Sphingobacteriales bacterium]
MKVLIIEDETELAKSIKAYLSHNTFICDLALNAYSASEYIAGYNYDCIILDISLPDGNGIEILRELKVKQNPVGVLIISARNSLDDKLTGLEIGADDYLTKPFHLPELAARVHAIIRRRVFSGNDYIVFDKLSVNIQDMNVRTGHGPIALTKKEYELLIYFLSNKNKVLTKEAILDHLWDEDAHRTDNYELIYSHVKNLRKKLMEKGCPDYFGSVYGIGYKFRIPKNEALTV